jgi:6-pyruvoyl-tetrahydropterin synthase
MLHQFKFFQIYFISIKIIDQLDHTLMFDEEDEDFLIEEASTKTLLKPIIEFFKTHTCYEMMPSSNKVVVFDMDTQVKEAFRFAAEERKKKINLKL